MKRGQGVCGTFKAFNLMHMHVLGSSSILHELLVLYRSNNYLWFSMDTLIIRVCFVDVRYWINMVKWILNFFPYSTEGVHKKP